MRGTRPDPCLLPVPATLACSALFVLDPGTSLAYQPHLPFASVLSSILLIILFSQYLRNLTLLFPVYRWGKGLTFFRIQIFKMFPVKNWKAAGAGTQTGTGPVPRARVWTAWEPER